MLGALGALIRKDQRTLFNKHSDGLFVIAPTLSHELEQEFVENLGERIRQEILDRWTREGLPISSNMGDSNDANNDGFSNNNEDLTGLSAFGGFGAGVNENDNNSNRINHNSNNSMDNHNTSNSNNLFSNESKSNENNDNNNNNNNYSNLQSHDATMEEFEFTQIRSAFEHCRLRVLYTSDESHEWVLYTPYNDTFFNEKFGNSNAKNEDKNGRNESNQTSNNNKLNSKQNDKSNNKNSNVNDSSILRFGSLDDDIDIDVDFIESKTNSNGKNNKRMNENDKNEVKTKYNSETTLNSNDLSMNNSNSNESLENDNKRKRSKKNRHRRKYSESHMTLEVIAGVYQKFNFEFGDGKFHDIISMGTTKNVAWNVAQCNMFDPFVVHLVGQVLQVQSEVDYLNEEPLPRELWHVIMSFAVDCFEPINHMVCVFLCFGFVCLFSFVLSPFFWIDLCNVFCLDQMTKFFFIAFVLFCL